MQRYKPEQIYHMHLHILFTTRNRLRIFLNDEIWKAFAKTVAECCTASGVELIYMEAGIKGKKGSQRFSASAAHIQVLLNGEITPSELCANIKARAWEAMQAVEGNKISRNPWTKDFYIADDTHYNEAEAYRFMMRRHFRTKELLYEEL